MEEAPYPKRQKLVDQPNSKPILNIPEDVIREILVRLPTKSIPRLRLICKSWNALIRSRSFIDLHRQSHGHGDHQSQLLLFDDECEGHAYVEAMDLSSLRCTPVFDVRNLLRALKSVTPTEFRKALLRVSGIDLPRDMIARLFDPFINVLSPLSNGIFCAVAQVCATTTPRRTTKPRRPNKFVERTYGYSTAAFCNPTTGEFQLISPPHVSEHRLDPLWAVNPISREKYALSVLKAKQYDNGVVVDYKMVMIMTYRDHPDWFRVFVYSLRRGVWKLIANDRFDPASFGFRFPTITQDIDFMPQATNLNGCCHWMTAKHSILRFDFASEEFGLIPGPITLPQSSNTMVWVMKEYGVEESWTKIESCSYPFEPNLQKFLGMFFSGDISDGSIVIERMFFLTRPGELLSYDCFGRVATKHSISSSRVLRKGCSYLNRELYELFHCMEAYKRSLVCWKTIGLSSYVETLEPVAVRYMRKRR